MTLVLDRTVEASPEQVFSVVADIGQAVEWMPAIQRIDDMSAGTFGVGTNWLETRLAGKRTVKSRVRVTRFEPGRVLEISVEGKGMVGSMRFTLIPTGGWTHVHYEADVQGRGVLKFSTKTMNREMEEADRDLLDRLAAQVEKSLQDT
jgi:carbon monoxide dehydrogenase subunit G